MELEIDEMVKDTLLVRIQSLGGLCPAFWYDWYTYRLIQMLVA